MNIQSILTVAVENALQQAGIQEKIDPIVKPATKKQFGDYQVNGIMSIAKRHGIPPRELAERVIKYITLSNIIAKIEIAGPGFINLFLSPHWLAQQAEQNIQQPNLNLTYPISQTIVVDYSGPNVAKEMHVGHIRSTVIGDAMVRTLEFLGHNVIRANHLGDWGTQFGMLIAHLEDLQKTQSEAVLSIADLEDFYRCAKARYDTDEDFAQQARHYVVRLQSGDRHCLTLWRKLVDITLLQNQKTYDRLGISLTKKDIMGESLYNPMLPSIVTDLMQQGLAVKDAGAVVVYLDEFKNKEGQPMGVIIQKQDGGFLYTTTDIASAKYRYEQLHADRILYYIDSRQHQHLMQAWSIVRKAGYVPEQVTLEHHMFGMMLDKSGRPFKTRSGGTIKLMDLLDEAVERATQLVQSKNNQLEAASAKELSNALAIAAVKYADLSKHRTTDYIFDWDTMLSFEGNTAPYLLYAYTRIQSIFQKGKIQPSHLEGQIILTETKEIELVTRLLQFEETIYQVAKEGLPHLLCAFLFDIAGLFSSFYENCPILSASSVELQQSRLKIVQLTAITLKTGLNLLGIATVDKM